MSDNLYLWVKSIKAFTLIVTIEETHAHLENDLSLVLKIIFETMKKV